MIKRVEEKDLAACAAVIRDSFLTVADAFGFTAENAPRFAAFSTTEEKLLVQLTAEHRPMYAFFDSETPVGFYSLLLQDNNQCELSNLCVLPTHRHRGIGEDLLNHAVQTAREFNCIKMNIGIVEENTVLRSWYESFGFVHTGTQKFEFFPFTCGYMERDLLSRFLSR